MSDTDAPRPDDRTPLPEGTPRVTLRLCGEGAQVTSIHLAGNKLTLIIEADIDASALDLAQSSRIPIHAPDAAPPAAASVQSHPPASAAALKPTSPAMPSPARVGEPERDAEWAVDFSAAAPESARAPTAEALAAEMSVPSSPSPVETEPRPVSSFVSSMPPPTSPFELAPVPAGHPASSPTMPQSASPAAVLSPDIDPAISRLASGPVASPASTGVFFPSDVIALAAAAHTPTPPSSQPLSRAPAASPFDAPSGVVSGGPAESAFPASFGPPATVAAVIETSSAPRFVLPPSAAPEPAVGPPHPAADPFAPSPMSQTAPAATATSPFSFPPSPPPTQASLTSTPFAAPAAPPAAAPSPFAPAEPPQPAASPFGLAPSPQASPAPMPFVAAPAVPSVAAPSPFAPAEAPQPAASPFGLAPSPQALPAPMPFVAAPAIPSAAASMPFVPGAAPQSAASPFGLTPSAQTSPSPTPFAAPATTQPAAPGAAPAPSGYLPPSNPEAASPGWERELAARKTQPASSASEDAVSKGKTAAIRGPGISSTLSASSSSRLAIGGGNEPRVGMSAASKTSGGASTGQTTVLIRYTCPRCRQQGLQAVDKVGAVVTCSQCGKAMRLVMKHEAAT